MNKKLTLSLESSIIENAKKYAKKNRVSLSKLIESYLNLLSTKSDKKSKVSPLVESLTVVIPSDEFDAITQRDNHI
jgi:hypothetical protein